ncbi:transcriptional antiterminator, BglG family [Anaerocolumna jejuensis DSM 15929]|uniref:Transcriptional antiterminator, BglG family n=1 Tax=Anaerocolumna jejuensis DSM 15929 TaxID=1121322 RepID=A0A1M6NU83_9FIRM|nr:transcriptional antiterminator, BglG family [Anaerocolumna jejuensis DSM 15929]
MRVQKAFNNNIVSAVDEQGKEMVIVGNGIGFSKKAGDMVDQSKISKIFYCAENSQEERMIKILKDIPIDLIQVTNKIMEMAQAVLNTKLNPMLLITLADHIHFAIQRTNTNMVMPSPLGHEIRYIYPKEYEAGSKALDYIKSTLNVILPKEETIFIALHFVNSQTEYEDISDTLKLSRILQEVIQVVKDELRIKIDESATTYCRFVVHLRYFVIRQLSKEQMIDDDVLELYDMVKTKYEKAYYCVQKINTLLKEKYNMVYSDSEEFYLVLHIQKMLSQLKGELHLQA